MVSLKINGYGTFPVKKGTNLLTILRKKHIPITVACDGRGRCGLCRVRIHGPVNRPQMPDRIFIPEPSLKKGFRLACQYTINNNCSVSLPTLKQKTTPLVKVDGIAIDIGTTVIKAVGVDLYTGRVINRASIHNPQNSMGVDVLSRVGAALDGNYNELCNMLSAGLTSLKHHVGVDHPRFTAVVGNPVMLSFFLKKDISGLVRYPFKSKFSKATLLRKPPTYVFPIIGGFVGGDTIAGILASGIYRMKKPHLYIDLGTNGEVVLTKGDRIYVTSTAAGPAFEGIGLSCGSLAIPGAIDRITYTHKGFKTHTIDNLDPIGICASGFLDLLRICLDNGFLAENGRLLRPITFDGMTLQQKDIRNLQLAIGALHAGIKVLLNEADLAPHKLDKIIITGEFGSHIDPDHLTRIGLLPETAHRVSTEKDLALQGALMALTDNKAFASIEKIRQRCKHIELANRPDFQKIFIDSFTLTPWH